MQNQLVPLIDARRIQMFSRRIVKHPVHAHGVIIVGMDIHSRGKNQEHGCCCADDSSDQHPQDFYGRIAFCPHVFLLFPAVFLPVVRTHL